MISLSFKEFVYLKESNTSRATSGEVTLVKHLKKHRLADKDATTAGSTGGKDFEVKHPVTAASIKGKQREYIGGELKDSVRGGKFGSVAIRYHKDKGWHVSESTKNKKPHLSAQVEKATVTHDGNTLSLLDHLNKHWGPSQVGKNHTTVNSDTTDMAPAHAYMQDHDVHLVHIGDRGTFRAGHSQATDIHNTGLPVLSGTGRFVVSTERKRTEAHQRAGTGMQVNFRPHPNSIKPSHINISTDEGAKEFKKSMSKKK